MSKTIITCNVLLFSTFVYIGWSTMNPNVNENEPLSDGQVCINTWMHTVSAREAFNICK